MYEFLKLRARLPGAALRHGRRLSALSTILLATVFAGCSADITRFDSASFNLNDPPETTAAVAPPVDDQSGSLHDSAVVRSETPGPYGAGAMGASPRGVEMAALPDATAPPGQRGYGAGRSVEQPLSGARSEPIAAQAAKGDVIEVQSGDTLYALSKRHQVSLAELMSVNDLKSPNLKPGQRLHLPGAGSVGAAPARHAALTLPKKAHIANDVSASADGSYIVKPGDSLYVIARSNKVKLEELQKVNGITDPRRVKPGMVLRMPGHGAPVLAAATPAPRPPLPAVEPAPTGESSGEDAPAPIAGAGPPPRTATVLNANKQVAALHDKATDANPETATAGKPEAVAMTATAPPPPASASKVADGNKLRWPASGKIISSFGGRPDGTHNDGINLSVPLGTDVHAAEGGVIAYAGSELKGYGNLVLVRHDNGWVTAYAHNDELLVKRNDKIRRGQVIAKAGKTGSVDQPQVHFELRQGSKPVDPTPFMERL